MKQKIQEVLDMIGKLKQETYSVSDYIREMQRAAEKLAGLYNSQKYQVMKVFDIQDAPKSVRDTFFELREDLGNNCYIEYEVYGSIIFENELPENPEIIYEDVRDGQKVFIVRGTDLISDWLYDNGAEISEDVIVAHWW